MFSSECKTPNAYCLSLSNDTSNNNNNNNNLLLGSSITKSGLHRGPNTRYILYNDTIKIYKLELKPKYINNYNIYTTRIKKNNNK